VALVPVGSDQRDLIRCVPQGGGTFAFWSSAPSVGQDRLYGAHLDSAGSVDIAAFDVASTPSGKSRLAVARSSAEFVVLAWSDDRSDAGDVLAQNVNDDGTLGGPATSVIGGSGLDGSLYLGAPRPNPVRGSTWIRYAVPGGTRARLEILDAGGRRVRALAATAGQQSAVRWDGRDTEGRSVAAGVYFVRLVAGNEVGARKLVVVR
jgi:hypothetical protein